MKVLMKRIILSSAFISMSWFAAAQQADAAANVVKVQVNDDLVQFPDAQPFIDNSSSLQVPLRLLSEKLGYQVDWNMEGQEVQVSLKNNQKTIELVTGNNEALVNGKSESLEGRAVFADSRTYVPLRFITEVFDTEIEWDQQNRIAIVEADGKPHKPAWIAPKVAAVQAAPAPAPKPVTPTLTEQVIQKAKANIGVPYRWGGTTPLGFDCSGFVNYVFQDKGIDLPRTSAQMHNAAGTAVSELQVGDLVFFANRTVDHVGIYLGNNQFISSTSSRGVIIESLSSNYWSKRYVGAKRVI
ncbi:Peptidoglycan endopeptidase LytF precursor [compost metagenome]